MKKLLIFSPVFFLSLLFLSKSAFAAGFAATGGGDQFIGSTFTVTITAGGTDFDTLQGTINVSGPVKIVSFSAGNATWLPGKAPQNNTQFVGMTTKTSNLKVATIQLQGTKTGVGSVSATNGELFFNGASVGTDSDKVTFTLSKAPVLPDLVKVSSSTQPDQNASYTNTTINLAWDKPAGISGFSYLLDDDKNTVPPTKVTSNTTSISYKDQPEGIYYFHIRAQNGDGWGETTHFKISIGGSSKIDSTLAQPSNIKITKDTDFSNNIDDGTVSGIKICGTAPIGATVTPTFIPEIKTPQGKSLSAVTDGKGNFTISIDFPVTTGTRKMTIQGQKDSVMTPTSDEITFELSQANGGSINILSKQNTETQTKGSLLNNLKTNFGDINLSSKTLLFQMIALIAVVASGILIIIFFFKSRR